MKETPGLFNGAMVRGILNGTKTNTRRIIKPQTAVLTDPLARGLGIQPPAIQNQAVIKCPFGEAGDRLWVRETFADTEQTGVNPADAWYVYRATDPDWSTMNGFKWTPSIHMPRQASRITLEITGVKAERLQDITPEDAIAEGIEMVMDNSPFGNRHEWKDYRDEDMLPFSKDYPISSFRSLWNSIYLDPRLTKNGYVSFPWSNEDFDAEYPGVRELGFYKGVPITVTENPWNWCVAFKLLEVKA